MAPNKLVGFHVSQVTTFKPESWEPYLSLNRQMYLMGVEENT